MVMRVLIALVIIVLLYSGIVFYSFGHDIKTITKSWLPNYLKRTFKEGAYYYRDFLKAFSEDCC
jgi:hypothetical protein